MLIKKGTQFFCHRLGKFLVHSKLPVCQFFGLYLWEDHERLQLCF